MDEISLLLQVNNVSKHYGITPVLTNISFHMNERERIGLVGVNGAGKSTLLKIISGELTADSGMIYKSKETTIGYLAQNSGLQSERSIWAELMLVFSHLVEVEQELRELEQQIADRRLPKTVLDMRRSWRDTLRGQNGSVSRADMPWRRRSAAF